MNNTPPPKQSKAIWYYMQNGESKGPITSAEFQKLYNSGIITGNTLIWSKGFQKWKPLSQHMKDVKEGKATTQSKATSTNQVSKKLIAPITLLLAATIGVFFYFQFFTKTPLEGAWQSKNFLGVTNTIVLFENRECWLYDSDKTPYSSAFQATKNGENSYTVTILKNNSSDPTTLLISFVDENTINLASPGSTSVYTMTRINQAMAKNIMGID